MVSQPAARIAFVGAGRHATESLYPNLAHIRGLDLVGVCDLDRARAERAARAYGAPEVFTDVEAMLDTLRPEGVCVCGPAEMHYEVGLEVLGRGIPVFVEKPPAPTLAQAEEMAAVAREQGVWGQVGFMKRFAPVNLLAREYMAGAEFGALSSITLIHGCGPYDDPRRMLMFNGIHMLDLARFLAGEVAQVFADSYSDGDGVRAVCAGLRFASGAVGQLNMNSGQHWQDCFEQTYVSGSGAAILLDSSRSLEVMAEGRRFARGEGLQLYGWSGRYYVSGNMAGWQASGHYTRGYWGELSQFARAVAGLAQPGSTLEDGVAAVRLVDAILASIESGAPVTP